MDLTGLGGFDTAIEFGSVCSGIEAASVAWEPIGWKAVWFAEIEPFPSRVLAHRWPRVPNYGDMLDLPARVARGEIAAPDVLVGGTPCQAFSVAGRRGSLEDERGALTLSYVELANAVDRRRADTGREPCIVVWENVPGVLNTKDNAFGCFLAGLAGETEPLVPAGPRWTNAGCVYGPQRAVAWRVLDAQYFGVAQRRRRVFVVASARTRLDPAAVLFEREGVRRDSPPSREARQDTAADAGCGFETAGTLNARTQGGGFPGSDGACAGHVIPVAFGQNRQSGPVDVSHAMNAHSGPHGRLDFESETFLVQPIGFPANLSSTQHASTENLSPALGAKNPTAVAFQERGRANGRELEIGGDVAYALTAPNGGGRAHERNILDASRLAVRRLTPVECERLQGFPDGHTDVPYRGKPAADGPRYKAIGNSKAIPCVQWLGRRIAAQLQPETGLAFDLDLDLDDFDLEFGT